MLRVLMPHGLGGDLVLADRHPGAADARILQALDTKMISSASARKK
jgi:hypothetical protein